MKNLNAVIGKFRVTEGPMASSPDDGNQGQFVIPRDDKTLLIIIAAGQIPDDAELKELQDGWEHVSVHARDKHIKRGRREWHARTPTWEEMCIVKDLIFGSDELVVQYHPKKEDYVNIHPHVLHLWHSKNHTIPMPPKELV